jgi:hypothetical protein
MAIPPGLPPKGPEMFTIPSFLACQERNEILGAKMRLKHMLAGNIHMVGDQPPRTKASQWRKDPDMLP